MHNQFIVSDSDTLNLTHLVALSTDEYGYHVVLFDTGDRMGISDDMYKKIMASIQNQRK